jgi:ATP-dependent Clp protease ATP-binding subunit ClpX
VKGITELSNLIFDDDEFSFDSGNDEPEYEGWRDSSDEQRREFVNRLPLISPQEIAARVEQCGYKGQDAPRRALALMAYRHVRRLRSLHLEGVDRRKLPPKQNTLLAGPTGCGKTYLVEILFQQIFQLPTVIVDITSFTESGYVGDDVKTILTRLVNAAEGSLPIAECGVVCLDEFDKIAASTSNARFAGEGTTKDVSGYGVQRELLTMLHGAEVLVPMDFGQSQFGPRAGLATHDIPFIACGAFAGMDTLLSASARSIGFRDSKRTVDGGGALILEEVESFQRYGFLPELMGRFTRIVSFPPLPAETLRRILIENNLPQYELEFRSEGLDLKVTDAALDHIIARSLKRKTGARGLHSELAAAIERAAFETFGDVNGAEVVVDAVDGKLKSQVLR